jgi:hypothetical protein
MKFSCRTWTGTGGAGIAQRGGALGISEIRPLKLVMITVCTDTKNVSESFFGGMADAYTPNPAPRRIFCAN